MKFMSGYLSLETCVRPVRPNYLNMWRVGALTRGWYSTWATGGGRRLGAEEIRHLGNYTRNSHASADRHKSYRYVPLSSTTTKIMTLPISLLALLCLPIQLALADSNGMDMSMDGAMSLTTGSMLPYLHFSTDDSLWFLGWVPQSAGAMVGACIGLFLLALVDRWIAACRAVMEVHWNKRCVLHVGRWMRTVLMMWAGLAGHRWWNGMC